MIRSLRSLRCRLYALAMDLASAGGRAIPEHQAGIRGRLFWWAFGAAWVEEERAKGRL
jgi:hypothetical protein